MAPTFTVVMLSLALGQQPYPYYGGGQAADLGQIEYPTITPGSYGEPLYPYDSQEPWLHGYFQEIPAYRGHGYFRPYNYKHILSQTQAAQGWGISPTSTYSQQWWHRYQPYAATELQLSNREQPQYPSVVNDQIPGYQPTVPNYQPVSRPNSLPNYPNYGAPGSPY